MLGVVVLLFGRGSDVCRGSCGVMWTGEYSLLGFFLVFCGLGSGVFEVAMDVWTIGL